MLLDPPSILPRGQNRVLIVEEWFGLGMESPIDLGFEEAIESGRYVDLALAVRPAGFEQQHTHAAILAEPVR